MDVTPQVSQEDSERRKKVVASSRPGQPGPGQYWEAWWQLGLVGSQQLERPSLPRPASCCVGPTPRITRMPTTPKKLCNDFFRDAQNLFLVQLTLIMQKIIKETLMGAFLENLPKMHCITLCKWSWLTLVTS